MSTFNQIATEGASQSRPGAAAERAGDEPIRERWLRQLRRQARRRAALVWTLRVSLAALILVAWQIVGHDNPLFTSYPTAVVSAGWHLIENGKLISALGSSFEILGLGLLFSVIIGVGLGLLIGRYELFAQTVEWLVNALNATPLLAVIPLVIVWFGLGITSKIVVVFSLTIFSMILNTAAGVEQVERHQLDVGRAFVASEGQIFRKIILPSSLPFIMTGLRISIGRALIGTVAAEFFTGISGLGGLIQTYASSYQTDYMLVPVLTLMVVGVALTAIAHRLERWATPWRD